MPSCNTILHRTLLLTGLSTILCSPAWGQHWLDVTASKLPATLPFSVTIGGQEHKGRLEAGPDKIFIAVRVVFRDSGELARVRVDRTVLKDSAGKNYPPVAFAPIKIEMLVPFAEVTQFYGGVFSSGSPEAGSSYMISQMRGPTEYSRSGPKGTSFILVFPLPGDPVRLTLTIPGQASIPVDVK